MNRPVGVLPAVAACLLVIGMAGDSLSAVPAEAAAGWGEQIPRRALSSMGQGLVARRDAAVPGQVRLAGAPSATSGPLGKGVAGIDRWQANRFSSTVRRPPSSSTATTRRSTSNTARQLAVL